MSAVTTVRNVQQQRPFGHDRHQPPYRQPVLTDNAYIWITLVVILPILFTIMICLIAICLYRSRKRRARRNPMNSIITPIDQDHSAIFTIFSNPQPNAYIIEEPPPSYELISVANKGVSSNQNGMVMPAPPPLYNSDPTKML